MCFSKLFVFANLFFIHYQFFRIHILFSHIDDRVEKFFKYIEKKILNEK